jgi:hypothetical protein
LCGMWSMPARINSTHSRAVSSACTIGVARVILTASLGLAWHVVNACKSQQYAQQGSPAAHTT